MKRFFVLITFLATNLGLATQPLSFIFFGDWGTGEVGQVEVAKGMKTFCATHQCEFGITLGDNFYPNGVANVNDPQFKYKFEDLYHPLGFDIYISLGNHDHMQNAKAQLDYAKKNPRWVMPAAYYTFAKKNVRFFVLDTEKFGSNQAKWLEEAIASSNSQWKIVLGHHPIYSYGVHSNNEYLIKSLLPVLKGKVDMYLAGHDHDLQIIEKDGLPFVISGTAGKLRPAKSGPGTVYADSKFGFSHLKIENDEANLRMVDKNAQTLFQRKYRKTQDSTIPGVF